MSILNAFTYMSRIIYKQNCFQVQVVLWQLIAVQAYSQWIRQLMHTTKPPFSNHRPASVASYEWPLLADQKLHEAISFGYELKPG